MYIRPVCLLGRTKLHSKLLICVKKFSFFPELIIVTVLHFLNLGVIINSTHCQLFFLLIHLFIANHFPSGLQNWREISA